MSVLSQLRTFLYKKYTRVFPWDCRTFYGMTMGEDTIILRRSNLEWNLNLKGIHIGRYKMLAGLVVMKSLKRASTEFC